MIRPARPERQLRTRRFRLLARRGREAVTPVFCWLSRGAPHHMASLPLSLTWSGGSRRTVSTAPHGATRPELLPRREPRGQLRPMHPGGGPRRPPTGRAGGAPHSLTDALFPRSPTAPGLFRGAPGPMSPAAAGPGLLVASRARVASRHAPAAGSCSTALASRAVGRRHRLKRRICGPVL